MDTWIVTYGAETTAGVEGVEYGWFDHVAFLSGVVEMRLWDWKMTLH